MKFYQVGKIFFVFLILYLVSSNGAYSQKSSPADSIRLVSLAIEGNGTIGPYFLPDYHILLQSETIIKNDKVLKRDQDYKLDYNKGILSFGEPLTQKDSLKVIYAKLSSRLERSYFHRQIIYARDKPQDISILKIEEKRWIERRRVPSDFKLGGSKLFSLEAGSSKDFSLRQALRLSLSGHITEDVKINALLSDQSSPTATSGTTKKLEELDKVLIQLVSPHLEGTLGDYYLSYQDNRLASYEKKLKGIMLEGRMKSFSSSFAFASSKGEYFTNRFQGIEGKQGPYKLKGKQGETNIAILAGTEKVWVDGGLMIRGSENDYVIDYNLATIHFTSKRLITSDSRINVDFEYSIENYQRDFYTGGLNSSFLQGKVGLKAIAIFENENKDNPLSLSLSSEDKDKLSEAGDDDYQASKSGAELVGSGNGTYQKNLDSLGNEYYEYIGPDSGSYNVAFSWVGEGKGDYIYQGGGIYKYVYPDNGEYLPIIFLPLPSKHSVLDLVLTLRPSNSFKAEIEWAKSQRDLNTFSNKDDDDNWGDALDLRYGFDKSNFNIFGGNFSQVKFQGKFRYLTDSYSPLGRIDKIERERDWDLPLDILVSDEREQRYFGVILPSKKVKVELDYGKLDLLGKFSSKRKGISLNLSPLKQIRSKIKWEDIESWQQSDSLKVDKDWTKSLVELMGEAKKVSSNFNWEREKRTLKSPLSSNGELFNQYKINVASSGWENFAISTGYSYRQDDKLQERWLRESISHIWQSRIAVKDWARSVSLNLEYARRVKYFKEISGANNKENLANLRLDIYPPNQLLNLSLYFGVNQTQSAQRVKNYIDVGEGNGDWSFQDGQYVPDPDGNYILITELLGDPKSLTDLNKNIRLLFSPYKLFLDKKSESWGKSLLKKFYTDTFINMNHQVSGKVKWFQYFAYPWSFSAGEAFFENSLFRQDVYLFPHNRKLTLRFRWEKQRQMDNLLSYGKEKRQNLKKEVLIRSQLTPRYSLEAEGGREDKEDIGVGTNYEIKGYYLRNQVSYFPQKNVELILSAKFKQEKEKINSLKADILSLSPKMIWSLTKKGRVRGDFSWTGVWFSPKGRRIPWQMALGKQIGNNYNWSLSFEYRFNQYITSYFLYNGKSEPNRKTRHFARAEVRAYF